MTKEAIIEKLKPIVQPFVKNEEAFKNLSDTTDFITDLNINSANLVDIVLDIEEAWATFHSGCKRRCSKNILQK